MKSKQDAMAMWRSAEKVLSNPLLWRMDWVDVRPAIRQQESATKLLRRVK